MIIAEKHKHKKVLQMIGIAQATGSRHNQLTAEGLCMLPNYFSLISLFTRSSVDRVINAFLRSGDYTRFTTNHSDAELARPGQF